MMWGALFHMLEDKARALHDWTQNVMDEFVSFHAVHPWLARLTCLVYIYTGWSLFY